MGLGDKVIRRNSLTTLHPMPTQEAQPGLERQKTVPHGFNVRERERERERQTERQTDREKEGETDRSRQNDMTTREKIEREINRKSLRER